MDGMAVICWDLVYFQVFQNLKSENNLNGV